MAKGFPIGADTTAETSDQRHELLTKAGNVTNEYLYVKAGEAITQYSAVGVNSAGSAVMLTKARADAGDTIGFAQIAFTNAYYGWVALNGPVTVRLKNACLPAVPLYTSATVGAFDDTSASQTRVYGIRATDTATASGAAKTCIAQAAVVS
jgi:hypothetical protein